MAKKPKPQKPKKKKIVITVEILAIISSVLIIALIFYYAVMEKMLIWLTAASSCSWLAFSGVYIYILVTDKYQLIKKEGFYLGQPLSPLETSFFAYVYAVCLVAIGTMLAVAFFREICA